MCRFRRQERFALSVSPADHAVLNVEDRLEHSHKSQQPEQLILANDLNRQFGNSTSALAI
jgi:hypothetical protein